MLHHANQIVNQTTLITNVLKFKWLSLAQTDFN